MSTPDFSADDFARALQRLLPRGRVWNESADSVQMQVLTGLATSLATQSDRALNLLTDAFPEDTIELLSEWEDTLGLPDPCASGTLTIQSRRNQVIARFTNSGGQSASYFIEYAANLGYTVTVENYAPFRVGQSHVGDPLGGEEWHFTWAIDAPLNTITYFRTGSSAVGEALATWQNAVLECELSSLKPAHTYLNFIYSSG